MLEPVCAGIDSDQSIIDLLWLIGIKEKKWARADVSRIIEAEGQFIGVFVEGTCVGAAKVTYKHPYECERAPFSFAIPEDGRVPCEVDLLGVDASHRRSLGDMGADVLDALVKGLYRLHRDHGGTHIYALCEIWTYRVLTTGYVGIVGQTVGEGKHYMCGTAICPSPDCQLTYVCELDMRASEANWAQNRPSFWTYLNQ